MMQARETSVNKWGSSLGIRLPREFTDLFNIKHKSNVKIEMKNDVLLVTPVTEMRKRKPLAEILFDKLEKGEWDGTPAEITIEDNEWLSSPSVGAEVVKYD
ncbi:MAG: AbrB/MazE/SpoVT family DNA-binding domain-containing protein [Defluviitaleaceae bacterium]|nr:AbrB/MazE/SpoVT family DNA-binding domain-containing protein [Defluviitaleaceae bacterium]